MDAVKLEARWPPDGKHRLATDFGIYKEPDGEKRPGGAEDRAAGFLLVVSLIAAVAVVVSIARVYYYKGRVRTTRRFVVNRHCLLTSFSEEKYGSRRR